MASLLVKQFDSLALGARKCSIKQVINQVQRWLAQQAKEVWEIFVKLGFVFDLVRMAVLKGLSLLSLVSY